ncbi:MAG: tetratricopeptide repeat protein [Planctomycetota bacterium]|nr:tetratricopeptide repeat protein [Planctomycetota bacterium]
MTQDPKTESNELNKPAQSEPASAVQDTATPEPENPSAVFFSPVVFGVVLVIAILIGISMTNKDQNKGTLVEVPVEGREAPYRKFIRDARVTIALAQKELANNNVQAAQRAKESALSDLRRAHKMAPDEAETNAELGNFLCSTRQFLAAEPYLARARQLDPKRAEIAHTYAKCLANLNQMDAALREIAEATRLAPNKIELLLYAGDLSIRAYKEPQAIAYLSLLLKMSPKHKEALSSLAAAQTRTGDHLSAVRTYQTYLGHYPFDADAHELYQQMSLRAGMGEELIADYQKRYKDDPNIMYGRLLARALMRFPDKLDIARRIISQGLSENANNIELQIEMASLEFLSENYKEANRWLDRVIQSKQSPDKAFKVRALVARAEKDVTTAGKMYQRLVERDKISANLGVISLFRDTKDYRRALERIKKIQQQVPRAGQLVLTGIAAEVFLESGRVDNSIDTYTKAIAKGGGRPHVYEGMGRALLVKGRIVEGIRAFSSGLPGKSKDPVRVRGKESLLLWRGAAYALKGEFERAKEDFLAVTKTEKKHLPYAVYSAIAKHMLGELSAEELGKVARFHHQGIFFKNDRLFFEAIALEMSGQAAAAKLKYQESRQNTIGDESPARLVDKRLEYLNKK